MEPLVENVAFDIRIRSVPFLLLSHAASRLDTLQQAKFGPTSTTRRVNIMYAPSKHNKDSCLLSLETRA